MAAKAAPTRQTRTREMLRLKIGKFILKKNIGLFSCYNFTLKILRGNILQLKNWTKMKNGN
jgi:hypothetical protein